MKVRIIFEDNRYYVEYKSLFFWIKYKREVLMPPSEVMEFSVDFSTYDKAFQCANELIENKKAGK